MRKSKVVFESRTLVNPAGLRPFRIRANDILYEDGWDASQLYAAICRAEDSGLFSVSEWLRREIASLNASPPPLGGPDIAGKLAIHIWSKLYPKMRSLFFPYLLLTTADKDGNEYTVHVPDGFVEAVCRRLTARITNEKQGICSEGVPGSFLRYLGRAKWRFTFTCRNIETGDWETAVPTSRTMSDYGPVWLMRKSVCFPVLTFEPAGEEPKPCYVISAADPCRIADNVRFWQTAMFSRGAGLVRGKTPRQTVLDWDTLCEPQWLELMANAPVDLSLVKERDADTASRMILSEVIAKAPLKPTPTRQRTLAQLREMFGWDEYRNTVLWMRNGGKLR